MWLPLEWPSEQEANGMVMARGSNKMHQQLVTNGSLSAGVSDDVDTLPESDANGILKVYRLQFQMTGN